MKYSELQFKLQPLRITPGWRVEINIIFEVDPSTDTMKWFYGSCLFSATNEKYRQAIELTYAPEGDLNGSYILRCFEITNKHEKTYKKSTFDDYDSVFEKLMKSRVEVVNVIEMYFFDELKMKKK